MAAVKPPVDAIETLDVPLPFTKKLMPPVDPAIISKELEETPNPYTTEALSYKRILFAVPAVPKVVGVITNDAPGEVVPIPTKPELRIRNADARVLAVDPVVPTAAT